MYLGVLNCIKTKLVCLQLCFKFQMKKYYIMEHVILSYDYKTVQQQ